MWENTVITNAGIELLKNALSGGTITVTAIKSGAGKVDVSALKSQTAVSSIKQSGTVQGVTKTNETIKIGVLFSNAGLSAGYSMTQLGIYAKGSTGSEVLFAISQSTTGKEVPAESAMPSWSLVHNFYIKLNNDVTMTATVDPEGYVTFETMQTALNTHTGNKNNPHGVTKSQIGLGNVPNVATNDQTPTYSDTTTLVTLSSGEKISIAFAKIKLAITTLINHLANKSNPHGVTKSQVGLGSVENKSSATIRGELTKENVTTALGYTPPKQDTNTWRGIQNNLTSDATDQSLSAAQGKVLKGFVDGKAASVHTHNYAGSSSAGGSANSAVKLDTATAGSTTQPVYFADGKPTACTYTLGKSVPSNAVFTDTWRGIQNNLNSDATDQSLSAAQGKALNTGLTSHTGNKSNPHGVTKAQLGLGNVENKSSAAIRGELTNSNVTTALGFTPAKQTDMKNAQDAITQLNSDKTWKHIFDGKISEEFQVPNQYKEIVIQITIASTGVTDITLPEIYITDLNTWWNKVTSYWYNNNYNACVLMTYNSGNRKISMNEKWFICNPSGYDVSYIVYGRQ